MSRHLAGLLALLLVVQGLLPVASHTTLAVDGRGEVVQICTLDGLQTRVVDQQGRLSPEAPPGDDINPAVQFSLLTAEVLGSLQMPLATPAVFDTLPVGDIRRTAPSSAVAGLRPIRAPPLA
ncbi:MAG: hypothetical protein U5S82_14545 [Gammaproteobacteria bacterium]|nr:hypothetical protein [Gammaproteobacteria bacterium]